MILGRIDLYPIKSLDGVSVKEARITSGGILEHDRVHAIVDGSGAYVNGKRTGRVNLLRVAFGADFQEASFWTNGDASRQQFVLGEPAPLNRWLSDFFGFAVELASERSNGFPDDRKAFGPTICSEASLRSVVDWFPELTLESARRRFRSNLEIEGVQPFWEDRLFGAPGASRPFRIGEVAFHGHNPCQRCIVPSRDPDGGVQSIPHFQRAFMDFRKKQTPSWANTEHFNHFYRFAINTSIPPAEAGKHLRVGDSICLP